MGKVYCDSVKYIVKTGDSNINNTIIYVYVYHSGGQVLRADKYAVKKDKFSISPYPPYVRGTSYILPYDVTPDMLDIAERLPYRPVDDAFMTGVMRVISDTKVKQSVDLIDLADRSTRPCSLH
ncbi:hypothetical protein CHS0354_032702 [Potamilus streckersoni]|uniref:Hexosyltransferase n=1 Tax=Potamilus streckersoni TaxID=2493646 RepID=A0AAE0VH46_9BIVA|nr:hypothetical protein CHS0354_032702 [Potamilus streckersoni]